LSKIPFPSNLFISDMKETFCEKNGLLDEIIHPLYRELTQEEEEKIYQGIIRNFSLDDKVEITNEDEKNILEKVSKGEIDTLREYILEKIKSEKK
jgi:hypothetical protein